MIKHDFHLHSSFSSDSEASMESMIEQAILLNLDTICFTEHFDPDFPENEEQLDFLLDFDSYQKACREYRERYQDKIKILHGIEIGVQSHLSSYLTDFYVHFGKDYDFILSSCHVSAGMDPYEPAYFQTYPGEKGMRVYLETLCNNIDIFPHFQSLAHLDYAYRYYPAPRPEFSYSTYGDIIDEILMKIIRQNKALEVNTSGLRSGLPFPNPHLSILKRFRELGGEMITIGSDAHKPQDIGHAFDKISAYLKESGFSYYTVFENQQPEMIRL